MVSKSRSFNCIPSKNVVTISLCQFYTRLSNTTMIKKNIWSSRETQKYLNLYREATLRFRKKRQPFHFFIYLFKETHTNYLHCSYSTYNTTLNTYSTYNTMLNTYSTYNTTLNTYSTYNTTLNTYSTYNTIQYSTKQYNTILTLSTMLNLHKYKDTLTLHNTITYTITIAIKKTLLTKRKENKHRG